MARRKPTTKNRENNNNADTTELSPAPSASENPTACSYETKEEAIEDCIEQVRELGWTDEELNNMRDFVKAWNYPDWTYHIRCRETIEQVLKQTRILMDVIIPDRLSKKWKSEAHRKRAQKKRKKRAERALAQENIRPKDIPLPDSPTLSPTSEPSDEPRPLDEQDPQRPILPQQPDQPQPQPEPTPEPQQEDLLENEEWLKKLSAAEKESWKKYLKQLKEDEETNWLANDENAVKYLEKLFENGYQPSDRGKIKFSQTSEGGKFKAKISYYPEEGAEEFSAFNWRKVVVDNYWPLKRDFLNRITENEHWEQKVNEEIGEREEGDERTIIQQIESFIRNSSSKECLTQNIKKIENLARRELAYSDNNWRDDIITSENREDIFYNANLADTQITECLQLLIDIQTILTRNEENIAEFLANEEERERIKNYFIDSSRDAEAKAGVLFEKASFVNNYFEYYDIDKLEIEQLKDAYQVYKKTIEKAKPSRYAEWANLLGKIHGENWKDILTTKRKKIRLAHQLLEWNERKYFDDIANLDPIVKSEIKGWLVNRTWAFEHEYLVWATNKIGVQPQKLIELKTTVGLERNREELEKALNEFKDNYLEFKVIIDEINANPQFDEEDWVEPYLEHCLRLELLWLFKEAEEPNKTLEELKKYQQGVEVFRQAFNNSYAKIWEELNQDHQSSTVGNVVTTAATWERSIPIMGEASVSLSSAVINSFVPEKAINFFKEKNGSAEEALKNLNEKIERFEEWTKNAEQQLETLEGSARQIWKQEELVDFLQQVENFPFVVEIDEARREEYRGFRQGFLTKKNIKEKLEEIKTLVEKSTSDYKNIEQEIKEILEQDIKERYYNNENSGSETPGLDLTLIKSDINKLKDFIPQKEENNKSLNGNELSVAHSRFFTDHENDLLNRLLWLEKHEYLEENGAELNESEKSEIANCKNRDELKIILGLIEWWKREILPGRPKELRKIWQEHFLPKQQQLSYWEEDTEPEKIEKDLKKLVDNNWDKYFVDAEKIKKLGFDFTLKSGNKVINCFDENYEAVKKQMKWNEFYALHNIEEENEASWDDYYNNDNLTGAEQLYTDASNPLPEFPWSSELTEDEKNEINQLQSPETIIEWQKNKAWDQFFQDNNITDEAEKTAWKDASGLENILEARKVWNNGWTLAGPSVKELKGNKIIRYSNFNYNIDVHLLNHCREEVDKSLEWSQKISETTDINELPANDQIVFDDSKVPEDAKIANVIEEKDDKHLELFKNAFKDENGSYIIPENQIEDWLKAETGLEKNGNEERQAFDNGWKDSATITEGKHKYSILDKNIFLLNRNIQKEEIEVDVKEVKKEQLDLVSNLLNKIVNVENTSDLSENYVDFDNKIESLPEDDTLPLNYKKSDVIDFYNECRRALIWIDEFKNDLTDDVNKNEILAWYRKKVDSVFIEPAKARKVFENHWKEGVSYRLSTDIVEAFVPSYTSFGQTDTEIDAFIIDKLELDKVNEILNKINRAQQETDLLTEADISAVKYDENKVPNNKNYNSVKAILKNKKQTLEIAKKNFKAQSDITKIENELNKAPAVSASELKKPDYKTEMISLVDDDTRRTARCKEIIAEINQIRNTKKLEGVREIINAAQSVLNKKQATKKELEKVINDLKILANATAGSVEQIVWGGERTKNQKLLTDLEAKLSKIIPPKEDPAPLPSPTPEEEKKKFGEDYANLEPTQQEGRKKIAENWKKVPNYSRNTICRYCTQQFHFDNNLEFLAAMEKANHELKSHEKNCSARKANLESAKKVEDNWKKTKQSNTRYFYACHKCWGKIEFDKAISGWGAAKKQVIADLVYHQEEECGHSLAKPKIAIYFSPNQGGNEHAPLTYAEKISEDELVLEMDNQGEIYQKVEENPTNWTPWVIGGGVVVALGIFAYLWKKVLRKETK